MNAKIKKIVNLFLFGLGFVFFLGGADKTFAGVAFQFHNEDLANDINVKFPDASGNLRDLRGYQVVVSSEMPCNERKAGWKVVITNNPTTGVFTSGYYFLPNNATATDAVTGKTRAQACADGPSGQEGRWVDTNDTADTAENPGVICRNNPFGIRLILLPGHNLPTADVVYQGFTLYFVDNLGGGVYNQIDVANDSDKNFYERTETIVNLEGALFYARWTRPATAGIEVSAVKKEGGEIPGVVIGGNVVGGVNFGGTTPYDRQAPPYTPYTRGIELLAPDAPFADRKFRNWEIVSGSCNVDASNRDKVKCWLGRANTITKVKAVYDCVGGGCPVVVGVGEDATFSCSFGVEKQTKGVAGMRTHFKPVGLDVDMFEGIEYDTGTKSLNDNVKVWQIAPGHCYNCCRSSGPYNFDVDSDGSGPNEHQEWACCGYDIRGNCTGYGCCGTRVSNPTWIDKFYKIRYTRIEYIVDFGYEISPGVRAEARFTSAPASKRGALSEIQTRLLNGIWHQYAKQGEYNPTLSIKVDMVYDYYQRVFDHCTLAFSHASPSSVFGGDSNAENISDAVYLSSSPKTNIEACGTAANSYTLENTDSPIKIKDFDEKNWSEVPS